MTTPMKRQNGKAKQVRKKWRIRRSKRRKLAVVSILLAVLTGVAVMFLQPRMIIYFLMAIAVLLICEAILLYLKKGLHSGIYAAILAACIVCAIIGSGYYGYISVQGEKLSVYTKSLQLSQQPGREITELKSLETLDLSSEEITEFDLFKSLKSLKQIDARGNHAFTAETRAEFAKALPNCEVLWSVPIDGEYFDSDSTTIDLSSHNLTGAQLSKIIADFPEYKIDYCVNVLGQRVGKDTKELILTDSNAYDFDQLTDAMLVLPSVEKIDLSVRPMSSDEAGALYDAFPNIEKVLTFDVPGKDKIGTDTTVITLSSGNYETVCNYAAFFPYMPNFEGIDVRSVKLSKSEIDQLMADYPDVLFNFSFKMFDVKVTSASEKVVLDGNKVKSIEAVEAYLKYLPRLKQLDMCSCGLSNEEMAQLRDRHPDIKIVWKVSFGKYRVRTDCQAFSTDLAGTNTYGYKSSTFQPLTYCTDLLFLDLGHCSLKNISFVRAFPKLRVLIFACNKISDISPLADLKDLEYIELFTNKITDWTPLANLNHLLDLNITRNSVKDITPFLSMPALQRLWIGGCGVSAAGLKQIQEAHPNLKISTASHPTGDGWREHERYPMIEYMYNNRKYVPFPNITWDSYESSETGSDAVTTEEDDAAYDEASEDDSES